VRVLELRQYTLLPGRRDELIELFEREFVESQEALGMQIVGTFRDLDDAGRFIWLRVRRYGRQGRGPVRLLHRTGVEDSQQPSERHHGR
jgi:hypothetical protein